MTYLRKRLKNVFYYAPRATVANMCWRWLLDTHLEVSLTDIVAPRPSFTPQPVRVIPEVRLEHRLQASRIERKARFEQHDNLEAEVDGILVLGEHHTVFLYKRRILAVHQKPERLVVAVRSMSHCKANVQHVALEQLCYLYGVWRVRNKGELFAGLIRLKPAE